MTSILHFQLDRAEGSLQRLIGLIERRGFEIDHMTVGGHDASTRSLAVGVRARDAGRCVDVLGRQIDRLYGVRRTSAAGEEPFHRGVVACAP
jgi:acetolactate synthase-1/3 small subunit